MKLTTYTPPQVTDYGTLLELTADVDVNFFGFASNLVLAAMSGPTGGNQPPDNTVLTPDQGGGGGGGGGTVTPDGPKGNGGGPGGGDAGDVGGRDVGGGGGGGGGSGGGGGGLAGGAPGGGGKKDLPFTGYAVMLAAGAGAALTSAGVLVRSKLRRRPPGSA